MIMNFLKKLLNIFMIKNTYRLVFSLTMLVLISLISDIKLSFAGGSGPYCYNIEYNNQCFSVKNNAYLIPTFIDKDKKNNRYAAERKWDVILNESFKVNLRNNNYNTKSNLKNESIKLELKKISDKNNFLRTFFKTFEYENDWCNEKIKKSLKFSTEIKKHLPNNEITQRLIAGRP